MAGQKNKSPEDFWREYEEKTGEKVIARSLGQYISGWEEFNGSPVNPIWGLVIATSGGFRFHHFPQTSWITVLSRLGSLNDPPKEKTIFIPSDRIISAVLHKETKWYKRIFLPNAPHLVIRYCDDTGAEKELLLQTEYKSDGIAEALSGMPERPNSPIR